MSLHDPADLLTVIDAPVPPSSEFTSELFDRLLIELDRPRQRFLSTPVRALAVAFALLLLLAGIATATYVIVRVAGNAPEHGILTVIGRGSGHGAATIAAVGPGGRLKTVWRCPRRVFCGDLTSMDWSPDGRRLTFTLDELGGLSAYVGLHIVNTRTGRDLHLPDMHLKHPYALVQPMAVLRAQLRKTKAALGCRLPSQVAWSLDSKRLAYSCGALFTIRFDGTGRRRIPTGTTSALKPSWSPNGKRLAFATGSDAAHSSIYSIDLDGAHRRLLVRDGASPSWSPDDGSTIAYESPDGVKLVTSDGVIRPGVGPQGEPRWSPDGSRLAVATGKGVLIVDPRTWRAKLATHERSLGIFGLVRPAWYPGGTPRIVPSPPHRRSECVPC
jgi:WD40-like Beta Propeller Repeat